MRHYSLVYVNQFYLSNKSVYNPPCPNKCFMNSLWRSFFCSFIAIGYIKLQTCSTGHGLVGVVEVDAPLFSPLCEPALSLKQICV